MKSTFIWKGKVSVYQKPVTETPRNTGYSIAYYFVIVFPAELQIQGLRHLKVSLTCSDLTYFARYHKWSNLPAFANEVISSSAATIFMFLLWRELHVINLLIKVCWIDKGDAPRPETSGYSSSRNCVVWSHWLWKPSLFLHYRNLLSYQTSWKLISSCHILLHLLYTTIDLHIKILHSIFSLLSGKQMHELVHNFSQSKKPFSLGCIASLNSCSFDSHLL